MSRTTLCLVPKDGPIRPYKQYQNAWGSSPYIWRYLNEKYLGNTTNYMMNMDNICKLSKDERCTNEDRGALVLTFDKAILEKKHFDIMSLFLKELAGKNKDDYICHLFAIADDLIEMKNEDCIGACFIWTSVCDDVWSIVENEVCRGYDVSKDNGHWFIGDEFPNIFSQKIGDKE